MVINLSKTCPMCKKKIIYTVMQFGENKDVFDLDELVTMGIDCPHCKASVQFEATAYDENGNEYYEGDEE